MSENFYSGYRCIRIYTLPALDSMFSRKSIAWACIDSLLWIISNSQSSFNLFWMFLLQVFTHFLLFFCYHQLVIPYLTSFGELQLLQCAVVLWLDLAFYKRMKLARMTPLWLSEKDRLNSMLELQTLFYSLIGNLVGITAVVSGIIIWARDKISQEVMKFLS